MKLKQPTAILCVFACTALFAFARTVRVGCFSNDDVLYKKQGEERNASYLTDFLSTINRYNDWQFEYVTLNYEEAGEALRNGTVDVLPFCGRGMDLSGEFLFSDIPSAVASLVLAGLHQPDMHHLRIGITYQAPPDMLFHIKNYAEQQGITYTLHPYETADKWREALENGDIDVVANIDLSLPADFHIYASISPIFFYIATKSTDEELYLQLSQALALTFNLTPDFLNTLRLRYIPAADAGVFDLTYREQQYLETKPLIRIAVMENQRPYSYFEKGRTQGIIIDQVRSIFSKSSLSYTLVPARTYKDAVALVQNNEADVIYALTDTHNETDAQTFKITNGIFRQRNVLVTHPGGITKDTCTFVAVRAYQYLSTFIKPNYNPATMIWCDTAQECLETIKRTKNSFSVLPSLEVNVYEQNHLFPGIKVEDEGYSNTLCIGISRRIGSELCSILDKTIHKVSADMMEDFLEGNVAMGRGLQAAIKQHPFLFFTVLIAVGFVLTLAVFLAIYNHTKRKKDRQIANAMNLANRDAMTGLYNHIAYEKLVNKTLEHQTENGMSAFIMIDIDNFKRINDTLGHGTGDLVIITLANTLLSTFRQGDLKCRMGGDEFSVFMKDIASHDDVSHKLSFLMKEIERAYEHLSIKVLVTCSVGAVICKGPCMGNFASLYAAADEALYSVKEGGKNSFAIAEAEIHGQESASTENRS